MRILDLLSSLCTRFLPSQTSVKPAPQVCAAPLTPPQSYPRPQPKPEPVAPLSAVAILDQEPDLTPAELATRAGVTLSYARSLVRRRNAKRSPAVVRPVAADTGVAVLQTQVRESGPRRLPREVVEHWCWIEAPLASPSISSLKNSGFQQAKLSSF
jgi:hypothetical protein